MIKTHLCGVRDAVLVDEALLMGIPASDQVLEPSFTAFRYRGAVNHVLIMISLVEIK